MGNTTDDDLKNTVRHCIKAGMKEIEIVDVFLEVPHYTVALIKAVPAAEKALTMAVLTMIEEVSWEPPTVS